MKVPWYPRETHHHTTLQGEASTTDLTGLRQMRQQCFAQNLQQEGVLKTTTADYIVE